MMKATLVAALLTIGVVSVAKADHGDRPGPDWIPIDKAIASLRGAGYGTISKVEADDGFWKAQALKGDTEFKVEVDPKTGRIAAVKKDHDDD